MTRQYTRGLTGRYGNRGPFDSDKLQLCHISSSSYKQTCEGKTIPFCSIWAFQLRRPHCKTGTYFGLLKLYYLTVLKPQAQNRPGAISLPRPEPSAQELRVWALQSPGKARGSVRLKTEVLHGRVLVPGLTLWRELSPAHSQQPQLPEPAHTPPAKKKKKTKVTV